MFTRLKKFIKLIAFTFLMAMIFGCSKTASTPTKMKVYLAGLGTLPTGIGDGGAILFGRSTDGKGFGKKILNSEEVLDIPNGQWTFYAVFWESNSTIMAGTVYCAKSSVSLVGSEATVNLSASNAQCADTDFSNGKHFTNGSGKIQFPETFVEDCDELPANGYGCGLSNQGNALSYRFVFSEYKKDATGILFSPNKIYSVCRAQTEANLDLAAPINFPVGVLGSPFLVQIEFFIGSSVCDTTDPKGVHTAFLNGGVGVPAGTGFVKASSRQCDSMLGTYYGAPAELVDREMMCINDLGTFTSGSCLYSSFKIAYRRFVPESQCQTASNTNSSFKHIVAIPKARICDPYNNFSGVIGAHPFAAGNGTRFRPYKICNEWQINQIGELGAPGAYSTAHYKLMNDLDMNKVNFGPYSKPNCEGVSGSVFEKFNNLNPLDGMVETNCETIKTTTGFSGIFWGNNKTIRNARIRSKEITKLGFVRELNSGGKIYDLVFRKPEIEGKNNVAVIAGMVATSSSSVNNIENVKIYQPYLEARQSSSAGGEVVGAVAGQLGPQSRIFRAQVFEGDVSGTTYVGGLVGDLSGRILQSSFNGIVEAYNSSGTDTYIGGIVAYSANGSEIKFSFSEGQLNTWTHYAGGISGKSIGTIEDSYSSMTVNSMYSNTGAFVGGIAGSNTGTINRVLYFGKLNYSGMGAGPFVNGVTDSGSVSASYSNFTPAGPAGSSSLTYAQFRDGTSISFPSSTWAIQSGYVPRLAYESRACLLTSNRAGIAAQQIAGRGSVSNPITICDADQFKNIGTASSGKFYVIEEDIDLFPFSLKSDLILSFEGTLNGKGNLLYGLNMTITDDAFNEYMGLIRNNSGTIANLNFSNFKIINSDQQDLSTGLLIGKNDGTIRNVIGANSEIDAALKVGLIVGENSGVIQRVYADYSKVKGYKEVGGIAGHNTASGNINRSASHAEIVNTSTPSDFSHYGGIVGKNLGSIDQVEFSGKIMTSSPTTNTGLYAGGIAGESSGSIQNVLVKKHGEIRVKDYQKVGGLIGSALSGSVHRSVFLGKLFYDNSGSFVPLSSYFNNLIGYLDGSVTTSHLVGSKFLSSTLIRTNQLISSAGSGPYEVSLDLLGHAENSTLTATSEKTDIIIPANMDSSAWPIPVQVLSNDIYTTDVNLAAKYTFALNIFSLKSYDLQSHHTSMSGYNYLLDELLSLTTYCPGGFSGSAGVEACNSGFDVAFEDETNSANNKGFDRVLNYYLAMMNDSSPTLTPPVWTFEGGGEDGIRLLQVED